MISLDSLWSRSTEVYSEMNSLLLKAVNPFMHVVNGQTCFKNLAVFTFLKYVWPFYTL